MLTKTLTLINGALAIALACYIYIMLPYAYADGCGDALSCKLPGSATQLLDSLAPVIIIAAVAYLALRIQRKHSRTSVLLLLLCPVVVRVPTKKWTP
jgi:hypothetical protein